MSELFITLPERGVNSELRGTSAEQGAESALTPDRRQKPRCSANPLGGAAGPILLRRSGSPPWKNGLSTTSRRPAQLRELRGRHVPSPFYPAPRVSRRSQSLLRRTRPAA